MADIITFESLYEALRREKVSQELQKLDDRFYGKVFSYLPEKHALLTSQQEKAHLFPQEPMKTQKQMGNAKKLVQDLFEKREAKILSLAMYGARLNDHILPSHLLKEEEQFYSDIQNLCALNRSATLASLFTVESSPIIAPKIMPPLSPENKPSQPQKKEKESEDLPEAQEPQSIKTNPDPPLLTKTVRFLHPTPKFVGNDLQIYGPFECEDIAELPEKAAELLIKKECAAPIEQTP